MTITVADHEDRAFLGHPRALGFLSFTEAWERFSYYGMNTLLVLYLAHQLLAPGHVEHVVGYPFLKSLLDPGNHLSSKQMATLIGGWYGACVYLTPSLVGGPLGDWLLGRTKTVVLGALLMAMGHFLMAFEQSVLLALVCLMLGSGCFKGNIASQVGSLYHEGDNRRADAFQIFYIGINAGVIIAPLVTGTLAEKVAWPWGFGAAGVGMLISLVIYLTGRRHFPPDPPLLIHRDKTAAGPTMSPQDWRLAGLLVLMLPVLAVSIVGNQEIFITYLLWAQQHADLRLFGFPILTEWMVSVDAVVSVATMAGMVVFWRLWAKRWREPDEFGKIVIGCVIAAAGVACLGVGALLAGPQKTPFGWLLLFHLLNDIGFANILPVGLALFVRAAPRAATGVIVGVYYLHLFAGNAFTGWLGTWLDRMPASAFWFMHMVLVAAAAVAIAFLAIPFRRVLAARGGEQPV